MMLLDEIRCRRIIVADVFEGNLTKAQWLLSAPVTSGPFYCLSFVVVSRFTLHAGTRKTAAAPVQKSNCWLRGSPAQKGRCANPCRRCRVPELPGELNNIEESWPRSSSVFPDPFPCCSATSDRSSISAGHYSRTPPKNKRGYGRKNGAGVFL